MNHSGYGKTMENVKSRMEMHLTTCDINAKKWFSKTNLKKLHEKFWIVYDRNV